MNYINFLNDITKKELENRKKLLEETKPINLKTDRHIIKLLTALTMIDTNLLKHIEQWKKSIKENNAPTPFYLSLWLKRAYNICESIRPELNYIAEDNQEKEVYNISDKAYKEIVSIAANPKREPGSAAINAEVEKQTLPEGFFDTFCTIMFAVKYLDKLDVTIKKLNLESKIEKIKKLFGYYEDLFENELICTSNIFTIEDYLNFKNKLLEN